MSCSRSITGTVVVLLTCMCLFLAAPALAQPTGFDGWQVVRITVADKAQLQTLRDLQQLGEAFEVWSEVVTLGEMEARVAPSAKRALAESGLTYRVIIEDLQKHLDELFAGPGNGSFFDSLRTYDEHEDFLDELVATWPNLVEKFSIGQSVLGREMWAIRVTGDSTVKTGVFFHGAEHGNEFAGSSLTAYVAWYLLSNYGVDPLATLLVDHIEWYFLPIMNPDGYVSSSRYNAHGVDLNRNWGGPGSGEDPWGGPYPFSEPETIAVRDFIEARPSLRVHLDIHGYVNWIIWAWAHIPDPCPDHDTFYAIGSEMRDRVAASGGGDYEIGSIYEVVYYAISGCSTNYVYGVQERWSMAIEVIDDDMPETCYEWLTGALYLGEWILSYDCNGNGVADAIDIASGTSSDCNDNMTPDECEDFCLADVDHNCTVDVLDLLAVIAAWGNPDGDEDVNRDGIVDVLDLLAVIGGWGPCASLPGAACCLPDGTCADMTQIQCVFADGDWYDGESCATFTCPALPTGACCVGDECVETDLLYFCDLLGGNWYEGETCPAFACPLIYCEATSEYCGDEYIANVQFGAINNSSGCVSGYDDYTYLINPMQIGVGQTITITNGEYWSSDLTTVWIDFNHNGDFSDAGEMFALGDPGGPVATGTITAPDGAHIGTTTMRIRIQYGGTPDPCGEMYYGEVEDYTVNISP